MSDTAEHGDYTGGPRVVTAETRKEMKKILDEIRNGTYARNWIQENEKGRPWFEAKRAKEQEHLIERVGAELRAMMPFLNPVTVKPGEGPIAVKPSQISQSRSFARSGRMTRERVPRRMRMRKPFSSSRYLEGISIIPTASLTLRG